MTTKAINQTNHPRLPYSKTNTGTREQGVSKSARARDVFYFERTGAPCTVHAYSVLRGMTFADAMTAMVDAATAEYEKVYQNGLRSDTAPDHDQPRYYRDWQVVEWKNRRFDRSKATEIYADAYEALGLVQVHGFDVREARVSPRRQRAGYRKPENRITVEQAAKRWRSFIGITASPYHAFAVVDGVVKDYSESHLTKTGRSKTLVGVWVDPAMLEAEEPVVDEVEADAEVEAPAPKPKRQRAKRLDDYNRLKLGHEAAELRARGWSNTQIAEALSASSRSAVWNWMTHHDSVGDLCGWCTL